MYIRLLIISILLLYTSSLVKAQVNHVRTWEVQKSNVTDPAALTQATASTDALMSSQYLDGLGRPVQTVSKGITPLGKDMVAPVAYDQYGREQFKHLPYASPGVDGSYKGTALTEQQNFYSDNNSNSPIKGQGETYYYGQTDYEASPLNRVREVFAPGNSWVGSRLTSSEKSLQYQYSTNAAADAVRIWTIAEAAGSRPASAATYPAGKLYKTITTDEANHQIAEYKDGEQRVILKKVQLAATPGADHTGWLCTYYVYDDFNHLRFVLQPKAVELINSTWSVTQDIADDLCFRYEYDNRHRMIIKKIPGADEVWMVYDNRDRMVYTQDGNMRSKNWWLTTLYDNFNRPVQTGMLTYNATREVLQNYVNGLTSSPSTRDASGTGISTTIDNMYLPQREVGRDNYKATSSIEFSDGFTSEDGAYFVAEIVPASTTSYTGIQSVNITTLPAGPYVPLTMTFYDNYGFTAKNYTTANNTKLNSIGTNPSGDALPTVKSSLVNGMATGARVRVIEDANDLTKGKWMESAIFYDDKGRPVQTNR